MINLATETILSFPMAAARVPSYRGGKKTHVATICRWATHGVQGVKLDTIRLGGRVLTSAEALQRFADELSAVRGSGPGQCNLPTVTARRRSAERAEGELAQLGI